MNIIPTHQTTTIREDTNRKIRILGNQYYIIKTLFEQMNLHRDDMFRIGKELEQELKNKKNISHLQNQKKRMKEALICWFTENFFHEIISQNPYIIGKLYKISNNKPAFAFINRKIQLIKETTSNTNAKNNPNITEYQYTQNPQISDCTKRSESTLYKEIESHHTGQAEDFKMEKSNNNDEKIQNSSIFSDVKANHEVDCFEFSNMQVRNNVQNNNYDNFNYEKLFDF